MNFIEVRGEFACFTNPLMKADRMTYPVITPSAADGILRSIYWHPGVNYRINRIFVLEPPKTSTITRAEIADKPRFDPARPYYVVDDDSNRQLRTETVLLKPHYIIDYEFELDEKFVTQTGEKGVDAVGKVTEIINRRLKNGKCYRRPFLGLREYSADFMEWEGGRKVPETVPWTEDLGLMLYGLDYTGEKPKPIMFEAKVENGVVDLRGVELYKTGGDEDA